MEHGARNLAGRGYIPSTHSLHIPQIFPRCGAVLPGSLHNLQVANPENAFTPKVSRTPKRAEVSIVPSIIRS